MASITFETIMMLLHVKETFERRNDPRYWTGWISYGKEDHRKVTVKKVSMDLHGIQFEIDDNANTIDLKGAPNVSNLSHTAVYLNGKQDAEAEMVFALKPTLGDLTRFEFDFRPVMLGEQQVRFNMLYDP